jgi:tetratricopeptide (TPR) repeat protein
LLNKPINIEVKHSFFFLLFAVFSVGCATSGPSNTYVQTVSSDLYPTEMARDQYYEEMARAYYQDGQTEKAIENFRLALLHNPKRASAKVGLSDAYRKIEMNQLAANELTEVLSWNAKDSTAWLKLGDLYLSAQVYLKAKQAFARVLELDPKNDKARWLLFYVARIEKDDVSAGQYLSQITETTENRTKLFFEKALLAKRQNHSEEYAKWIEAAYDSDPHNRKVCLEFVSEWVARSDFDSAFVLLNHYAQTHDFDLEVSQTLTFVAVHVGQFEIALAQLEQQKAVAEANEEKTVDIELKMAHVHFLQGKLQSAEELYQKVLAVDPTQDQANFYLGQIYAHQDLNDLAQPAFKQLSAASSYFADAQIWLASNEVKKGKSQLALQRLAKAQAQRPDQLPLYVAYIDLLIREKQYKKALSISKMGVEFFPQTEELHIQAAVANFHLGREEEFKKSISKAMAINPENAEIYSSLAELWYLKKFDPKDIEIFAKKALEFKSQNKNMKPLLAWALMAQERSLGSVALFEKFYEENPAQPFYAEALSKVYEAADISGKAEKMNAQALKLKNQKRLQSDLVFDSQRQPANATPSHK